MEMAPDSWPARFRGLIRTFNKHLLNPVMLHLAGRRFWYASILKHTGRRSGKVYSTPVVADLVGSDIIIPLPYGTQADWVRNVVTAGSATVVRKGQTLAARSPEIIDATQALPLLPRDRRRTFERVHIGHFLRMRVAR
ncbi:MAG: nitroreductase [Mycobacterium sp.]|nr:nitroreductase [Mycobacterium sp.]